MVDLSWPEMPPLSCSGTTKRGLPLREGLRMWYLDLSHSNLAISHRLWTKLGQQFIDFESVFEVSHATVLDG